MTFETVMKNAASAGSQEKVLEIVKQMWEPPTHYSMSQLEEIMRSNLPGGLLKEDKAGREERRELTERMQEKMTRMALNNRENWQRLPPGGGSVPRPLASITLDLVLDDPEEYGRRLAILQGNDPQAKAEVVRRSIRNIQPMLEQLRHPMVSKMSDREIVDHYEQIYMVNQSISQLDLDGLLRDESVAFTEQDRQEILGLVNEFMDPVAGAKSRGEAIASPYYERFPPQRFTHVGAEELMGRVAEEFQKHAPHEEESLNNYLFTLNVERTLVSEGLMSDLIRDESWLPDRRRRPEEIEWMDEMGKKLEVNPKTHLPDVTSTFMAGKPLIVRFPPEYEDEAQVFFPAKNGSGGYGLQRSEVKAVASFGAKEDARRTLDEVVNADPFFLPSSKEYKAMRKSMEAMDKFCKTIDTPPTTRQIMEMQELSQKLEETSKAYLDYKGEPKNDTERARIKAAQSVQRFAKQQSARVNTLLNGDPDLASDVKEERTKEQLRQAEQRSQKFEMLDDFLNNKGSRENGRQAVRAQRAALDWGSLSDLAPWERDRSLSPEERILLNSAREKYPAQLDKPGSVLNDLRDMILERVELMVRDGSNERQEADRAMTLMTTYDLISQEQAGRTTPGPMEKLLQRNMKGLFSAVEKSQAMQSLDDSLEDDGILWSGPSNKLNSFLDGNQGRSLAGQILREAKEKAHAQQQQQQPAQPQRSRQNPQKSGPAPG